MGEQGDKLMMNSLMKGVNHTTAGSSCDDDEIEGGDQDVDNIVIEGDEVENEFEKLQMEGNQNDCSLFQRCRECEQLADGNVDSDGYFYCNECLERFYSTTAGNDQGTKGNVI